MTFGPARWTPYGVRVTAKGMACTRRSGARPSLRASPSTRSTCAAKLDPRNWVLETPSRRSAVT